MYMSEISKSKNSGLKAQKMIISVTPKHVSAISEHPVPFVAFIRHQKNSKSTMYDFCRCSL